MEMLEVNSDGSTAIKVTGWKDTFSRLPETWYGVYIEKDETAA